MKIKTYFWHIRGILVISLLGLLLRIFNPTYGSPILYILGDEVSNYASAWSMLARHSLLSVSSPYPPLGAYMQLPFFILGYFILKLGGVVTTIESFKLFIATHEGIFLFIPRLQAALAGALTIPVIYAIARQLFPQEKRIALWSAFLMAVSLIHIQTSHFARPWSPALLCAALSTFSLLKYYTSQKKIWLLGTALFLVLNAGILQSWIYSFFLFILIQGYQFLFKERSLKLLGSTALIAIVVATAVFSFSKLTTFRLTIEKAQTEFDWGVRGNMPLLGYLKNPKNSELIPILFKSFVTTGLYTYNLRQLLEQETLLIVFFVVGLASIRSRRGIAACFSMYSLLVFLGISAFLDYQTRHLLPAWLGFVIVGGIGAVTLEDMLPLKIKLPFRIICIAVMLYLPLMWNQRFLQKPTFEFASQWIENSTSPQTWIACVTTRYCKFAPSKEAIKIMQQYKPEVYKTADSVLNDAFPDNVRNVLILEHFPGKNDTERFKNARAAHNFEYVFDSYWDPKRSLNYELDHQHVKLLHSYSPLSEEVVPFPIENMLNTVAAVPMPILLNRIHRSGPYVDVLKVF